MLNNRMIQRRVDRNYDRDQVQLDALTAKQAADKVEVDPIDERMAITATSQMRLAAMQVAFMLAAMLSETDNDDEEMLPSEVLDALMLEAFSEDEDDDEDGDEIDETVKTVFSAHVADALSALGVESSVISDLFDDDVEVADAAALAAGETVLENMPDDGDDFDSFVETFAYSADDDESFDGLDEDDDEDDEDEDEGQFDAAKKLTVGKKSTKKIGGVSHRYKAVKAMRNGKKVVINKRIGNKKVKLSAGQKASLKKAQKKAQAPRVIKKAMRSLKKGIKQNVYTGNPKKLAALAGANKSRSKRPPRTK